MNTNNIKKSVIAGTWYPGDKKELQKLIEDLLNKAEKKEFDGEIVALISPHAGYAYSGAIAAYSYKQVMGNKYDAVIIVAPSHRESFKGVSIYNRGAFETPLGLVPVDSELSDAIIAADEQIKASTEGHLEEHSLEIQLPFLQIALPDLKIVPIAMWDYTLDNCKRLANAIVTACSGKNVLLVASTDLYHGYDHKECQRSDDRTIDKILALQPEEFCQGIIEHEYMACGGGPVAVVEMAALKLGAKKAVLLARTNSADVTGERHGYVVGYCAVAIYKNEEKKVGIELGLSETDKQELLRIARQSIESGVHHKTPPEISSSSPILQEKRGAFVTITKGGALRGCIGYIYPVKPLAQTVQEMAAAAAFRDPRFPPLTEDELPDIEIEISVLTPLKEIKSIKEIEIGKHGILIEKKGQSGLLLPQVATEYGWDRETFLEHTCKKAGLSKNAWHDSDTKIMIFSAEIFHE